MPVLRSASSKSTAVKRSLAEAVSSSDEGPAAAGGGGGGALSDVEGRTQAVPRTPRKRARVQKPDDGSPTPTPTTTPKAARSRTSSPRKKPTTSTSTPSRSVPVPLPFIDVPRGVEPELVPAQLTFELHAAKTHLISVDPRFGEIFGRRGCKPFEVLETVDPFRTLATSILSQQISTMAARSVSHKFCRLYDASLPERYEDGQTWDLFPTAHQVAATPPSALRAAGLSQRKAEYLLDLAAHFTDGRISTHKLREASDEALSEMLIAVRGIGPWTVHMFAIFSMRHPDVLPVGDLGVQRGLARWALAAHSPKDAVTIPVDDEDNANRNDEVADVAEPDPELEPVPVARATTAEPDASSQLPAPPMTPRKARPQRSEESGAALNANDLLPPPITPSVSRILEKSEAKPSFDLPQGLSVTQLRSRLTGKTKVKGAILTPDEMEALTEHWKPYRSIGVYYMWALVDQ